MLNAVWFASFNRKLLEKATSLERSEKGQIPNLCLNTYIYVKKFLKIIPVDPEIIGLNWSLRNHLENKEN